MAITQNTYTGNGSTTTYSFTFQYLKTTDIKVSLDGVITTAYTLSNATTVTFTTAPASGAAIRIYRDTNTDNLNATFYPGSAIRSSDLNNNFTQNLYVTQEADFDVATANTTANTAKTTANTALTNSATAVSTANAASATATTADTNASAAVTTANAASATATTASTNAASAVTTANTASTNASAAVVTANSAATDAATAISTANGAVTTANAATTTANTAQSTATSATSTANTAATDASNAVTTANSATTTANNADTNATAAVNTANAAAASVASAAFYAPAASLANLPASPSNADRVEVSDSTGIESNANVSTVPTGFVGASDLTVRLQYNSTSSKWVFQNYLASDPDNRYLTTVTPVVKGDGTASGQVGKITLNCSNNNHGVAIQSPPHSAGATYTLTLPTGLPTIDGQSLSSDLSGNLSFSTVDSGFLTTKQTLTTSKTIDANINAAIMGPTVAIGNGTNISVGQNSLLFILK